MTGFLLINKPKNITSFAVIQQLRKITGIKKIGHAGTLDPLAQGLLICALERAATKQISTLIKKNKEYLAELKLGQISTTYDAEGQITTLSKTPQPTIKQIENILRKFQGNINQTPPIYSAKKINGIRAYKLARANKKITLKPALITIYSLEIISYSCPKLKLKINCSSGTYIRSLAHDIGQKLGCGAYLTDLTRTRIEGFSLNQALELKKLSSLNWQTYLINL